MTAPAWQETMRISLYNQSFIQIEKDKQDGYSYFDVSASIDGFSGRNSGVIFENCDAFLRLLHKFDERRSGTITLEGTEQFRLSLTAFDGAGHLRIDIRISKYAFQSDNRVTVLTFEGGFIFDTDYSIQIFSELRNLLQDCH